MGRDGKPSYSHILQAFESQGEKIGENDSSVWLGSQLYFWKKNMKGR